MINPLENGNTDRSQEFPSDEARLKIVLGCMLVILPPALACAAINAYFQGQFESWSTEAFIQWNLPWAMIYVASRITDKLSTLRASTLANEANNKGVSIPYPVFEANPTRPLRPTKESLGKSLKTDAVNTVLSAAIPPYAALLSVIHWTSAASNTITAIDIDQRIKKS